MKNAPLLLYLVLLISCSKTESDKYDCQEIGSIMVQSIYELDKILISSRQNSIFDNLLLQGIYNRYDGENFRESYPTKIDFVDTTYGFKPMNESCRQFIEQSIKETDQIEWLNSDYDEYFKLDKNKNRFVVSFSYPLIKDNEAILYVGYSSGKFLWGRYVFFFKKIDGKWILQLFDVTGYS